MSLSYIVGVNIVVVGDGQNTTIAFDLLRDYANVAGLGYRCDWLKGNFPTKVVSVQGAAVCDAGLSKNGHILYITFPSPPPKYAQISVDVNLVFESDADDDEVELAREMGKIEPQMRDLDRWTGATSGE